MCTGWAGTLGHSRSGRLWPSSAFILPRHQCHPYVFFNRQSWQPGKYPGEMDTRGKALLSKCANNPGRQQAWPAQWREHKARADEDETGTGARRGRPCNGWQDQRICILGVLCQDQRWCSRSLWDRHTSCSADKEEDIQEVPTSIACSHWHQSCLDI